MSATPCKHCGRAIAPGGNRYHVHLLDSGYNGKSRCDPDESGLMYGYNAAPIGETCSSPCIGTRYPDTKEADQ